jgi:hypothetical protein
MNLSFSKVNDEWVAEFQATNSFNLHLEREGSGDISIYQKTVGNKYAHVEFDVLPHQKVVDVDFTGGIFPKDIRIVCESQPTMGFITFAE